MKEKLKTTYRVMNAQDWSRRRKVPFLEREWIIRKEVQIGKNLKGYQVVRKITTSQKLFLDEFKDEAFENSSRHLLSRIYGGRPDFVLEIVDRLLSRQNGYGILS